MTCEKCKENMIFRIEGSVQGWSCPICGWNMVTTYINEIYEDMTEYSIYIKGTAEMNNDKIKLIAKIARVNFIVARQMLMKSDVCILKANAPEIKEVLVKLKELEISFEVSPMFKY